MTSAICAVPGCPAPAVERGVCARHRRTTSQRGYGVPHQRERERLAATLPAECGYDCGVVLQPNGDWVAAHVVDGHPEFGWLVSCRSCNERAKTGMQQAHVLAPPEPVETERSPMRVI